MIAAVERYNKISKTLDNSIKDNDFLTALETFIDIYKQETQRKQDPALPLSLYSNKNLGILEATVKYLKENLSLNYSQIARLINRDERTIWTSYHKAIKKQKEKYSTEKQEQNIPCNIFSERKQGPLEVLTIYLKDDLNLDYKQISELLNRDYRTVWLSYKNGKRKISKNN